MKCFNIKEDKLCTDYYQILEDYYKGIEISYDSKIIEEIIKRCYEINDENIRKNMIQKIILDALKDNQINQIVDINIEIITFNPNRAYIIQATKNKCRNKSEDKNIHL